MGYRVTIREDREYTRTERIMERRDEDGKFEYVEGKAKEISEMREVDIFDQRIDALDIAAVIKAVNRIV